MSKVHTYARNFLANCAGFVANALVMFLLSPFVVNKLGNAAYGVWSLLVSLTGYLGLVDLGVRCSTGRFINFYMGRGEMEKVNGVVSTSLVFYFAVSALILGAGAVLSLFFGQIFPKVPADLVSDARWVILLLCANIWLGLFSATFAQLLISRDRFDLQNTADIAVLLVRAAATVWVLIRGGGLVALAAVQVGSGVLGCAITYALARWKGVFVLLGWHWVSRHALREMFAFGIWAFIGTLGIRVVYYTSAILIGLLLGVEDIAFYAIGFMVIDFARGLVTQVAVVMSPDIDKTAGKGDLAELQWLMIRGIRMTMFLAVPLLVGLMVFGEEFIALWMGPGYTRSAEVLLLLTISQFAALATRPCTSVLSGLGHVRFIAALLIGEGALNLLASLFFVLVTHLGIHGVALGTVVSMLITNSLVQPAYVCRKIGMLLGRFTRETFLRWIAAGVVFAAVCVLARMVIPPAGWGRFALKVAALGLCYVPVGLLVALGAGERAAILALPFRSRRARAECGGG